MGNDQNDKPLLQARRAGWRSPKAAGIAPPTSPAANDPSAVELHPGLKAFLDELGRMAAERVLAHYCQNMEAAPLSPAAHQKPQPQSNVRNGDHHEGLAEPFVTIHAAAEFLGVKVSWLYEQVRLGHLPSYKLGKFRRFRLSELEAWVKGREEASAKEIGR